jgi:hypothetical protein
MDGACSTHRLKTSREEATSETGVVRMNDNIKRVWVKIRLADNRGQEQNGKFTDMGSNYQLFEKYPTPWSQSVTSLTQ